MDMGEIFNKHLKDRCEQLEKITAHNSGVGGNALKVLDVFVPLRSSISLNVTVQENTTESEIDNLELHKESNGKDKLLNNEHISDFISLLTSAIKNLVNQSGSSVGITLNERRLILSPIWKKGKKEKLCYIDIPSALNIYNKSVLLGQPGSGKSTIVKAIACAFIKNKLFTTGVTSEFDKIGLWDKTKQLCPIFIEIKEFTKESSFDETNANFLNFLLNSSELCNNNRNIHEIYKNALDNGTALVIFDGYDEIALSDDFETKWKKLQTLIDTLTTTYPNCKYIVTCRSTGYYSGKELEGFETITMSDLNNNEVGSIIDSYCNKYKVKDANKITDFKNHIKNPFYKELIKQPLFVFLLTTLYFKNNEKELPQIRSELLEKSISYLIQSSLTKDKLETYNDLIGKLKEIAYKSLVSGKGQIIPAENMLGLSNANQKVILEQAGLISQSSFDTIAPEYKFQLPLYQEYLAAYYLSKDKNGITKINNHLASSFNKWREVALLLGDIYLGTDNFWLLLSELIVDENLDKIWLANKIILQHQQHLKTKFANLVFKGQADLLREKSLKVILDYSCIPDADKKEIASKRADIARAISLYTDTRNGVGLKNNLPDISWCKIPDCSVAIGTTNEQKDSINKHITDLKEDPYKYKQEWSFDREQPSTDFDVTAFEISRYPVTVSQFQSFIDAPDGYNDDRWWTEKGKQWKTTGKLYTTEDLKKNIDISDNCPRTQVSWYECVAFCNWLGSKLNCKLRLPTEIEWEVAAKQCQNRIYPWGDSPDDHNCGYNTKELGIGAIIPVGCLNQDNVNMPTDMIGNIWEWCNSAVEIGNTLCKYDSYNAQRENIEIQGEVKRAARGGGFGNILIMTRCAFRGRDLEGEQLDRQGFRVVREIQETKIDVADERIKSVSEGYLHLHKRSNQNAQDKPVIVFSHGFITDGLENHRMFLNIAKQLNLEDYSTVLYDNFGCGYSDGEYTDFRFSNAVKDIVNVVNWAAENSVCNKKVILFGQSLGTAIITCAIKDIIVPIKALVLWNFSDKIESRYPEVFKQDIKDKIDMKSGQDFYIERKGVLVSGQFYKDACSFNISEELKNINSPTLFINSGADEIGDSNLSDNAISIIGINAPTQKYIIEGANHSFNCQPDKEKEAIEKTIEWLNSLQNQV